MIKLILSICLIMYSHSILAMDSAPPTTTKLTELQTSLQTLQTKLTDLSGYLTILQLRIQQHPLVEYFKNNLETMLFHRSFIDFICSLEATWDVELKYIEEDNINILYLTLKKNPACSVYFKQSRPNEHMIYFNTTASTIKKENSDWIKSVGSGTSSLSERIITLVRADTNEDLSMKDGLIIINHIANYCPTQTHQECFYSAHQAPTNLQTFIQSLIDQDWTASFKETFINILTPIPTLFLKKDNFYIVFQDNSGTQKYECSIAFNTTLKEDPLQSWEFTKKTKKETLINADGAETDFDTIHAFINQELTKGT